MVNTLLVPLHIKYIQALDKHKDELIYHMTTHLRMNGIYWGLTALCIMGHQDALSRDEMVDFVMQCWDEEVGAFGSHPGHDAHILSTLSAIQIITIQDALDRINSERVINFILSLQLPSGAFSGDRFGETDTRFLYCAISALSLLGQLPALDREGSDGRTRAIAHIMRCKNFDGGFGVGPGSETHACQVFVCVGALAILGRLDLVDVETLGWWLAERQLPCGGLNGRPEKLEDVCYSFWVLSGLSVLKKLHWINCEKLNEFILSAQDPEAGGITDRPDNTVDVFHTHVLASQGVSTSITPFGKKLNHRRTDSSGLSLLGYPGLNDLDPVCCMPAHVTEKLGLRKEWKSLPGKDI